MSIGKIPQKTFRVNNDSVEEGRRRTEQNHTAVKPKSSLKVDIDSRHVVEARKLTKHILVTTSKPHRQKNVNDMRAVRVDESLVCGRGYGN